MKIVFFNGGLANQVFQYIFYRFAQIRRPDEEWILDDSFFFVHHVHNGYELEKVFGLHPHFLSQTFDPDVWEYMMELKKEQNKSVPQLLLENGTDIMMIAETNTWQQWNPFDGRKEGSPTGEYNPGVINIDETVYYHGYWINAGWFRSIEKQIRSELVFPQIKDHQNLQYQKKIQETNSCSIHIRRGDYVDLGVSAPNDIYKAWITEMMKYVPDMTLFVFSDDLDYCRSHMQEMGMNIPQNVVFVEGNRKETAFRDLQLMSQCKNMINANSSFCYLAALLNKNLRHFISPPNRRL